VPQIALAYVLDQPLNIFALVGCAKRAEFAANLAALDIQLSTGEMLWLEGKTENL
jgi:aryl-alcohol dehydrogenase-like predicted oxidoreductase